MDAEQRVTLTLVPCEHVYLAMEYRGSSVVALCKHCRKRFDLTPQEWFKLKVARKALDKPVRL